MNNLTLFELAGEYQAVAATLTDLELGDEEVADALGDLAGDLQAKCTNIPKLSRNLTAAADSIKEARLAMQHREQMIRNRQARLLDYLKTGMEQAGVSKIESPWFTLAIRKNPPKVVIDAENLLPEDYVEIVTSAKIDKTSIGKMLKSGNFVDGAHLEQSTRLAIK